MPARNAPVIVVGLRPIAQSRPVNLVAFVRLTALVWASTCANVTSFTQVTRAPFLYVHNSTNVRPMANALHPTRACVTQALKSLIVSGESNVLS